MPSRRRYLQSAAGIATVGVLAGCSTPSADTPSPSDIAHGGSIVRTATEDEPMRARLSVTNESDQSVELLPESDTPLLADIPRFEHSTGSVVFYPPDVSGISAFGLAAGPTNGCWRFVNDDGEKIHRATIEPTPAPRRLAAGERKTTTHDVYYGEPTGGCFLAGAYETAVPMAFADESVEFALGYRLSVGAGGASISPIEATATDAQ